MTTVSATVTATSSVAASSHKMKPNLLAKVADSLEETYGLPRNFVAALKSLFDELDDQKTGFIKLADIECRWREEEYNPNVPPGLIDCLAKVQTANGTIDFERFCAGIKVCLLRAKLTNNKDDKRPQTSTEYEQRMPVAAYSNNNNANHYRVPQLLRQNHSFEERQSYQKVRIVVSVML